VFDDNLDELASGLAENEISRRQAIRWAGYGVVGAALSSMGFADTAEALTARQRRRCRNKGGIPLERGSCHCGFKCGANAARFRCKDNPNCACTRTTEGRGFCADFTTPCSSLETCSSSSQCPSGRKCVVGTCCGRRVCARPCTTNTTSAPQDAASRVSGLTLGGSSGD
jgi:hypothetical protein